MKRKITLCILLILIIMCVTLLSYEKINKTEISNDNGMFAIFLEEEKDSGRYQKSNLKTWPTEEEYTINMLKSYCENGSILRWNSKTKKISLKVNGTDKCYVYFDKAELGTEKHPHLIQTIEDLVRLSNDVNNGTTYAGEYFLLTNDLDFNDPSDYEDANRLDFKDINGINGVEPLIKELTTGSGFIPIGKNVIFTGNFNGNNKKIMNLYINDNINQVENARANGLFASIANCLIQNLTVSGNVTTKYEENIGGIVGVATNSTIKNCHNEVNVVSEAGTWSTGGILGTPYGKVDIIDCSNSGNVTGGSWIGGVIGGVGTGSILTMENCSNSGKVQKIDAVHYVGVGGLVGAAIDPNESEKITISNSYNEGEILIDLSNSEISPVGGIIGRSDANTIINNCSNTGVIETKNDNNAVIGGIIGFSNSTLDINDCHNKGKINSSNAKFIGGIIGGDNIVDNKTKITNSDNMGDINYASNILDTSSGGIIGYFSGSLSLDNCVNAGNIKYNIEESNNNSQFMGGIIGGTAYGTISRTISLNKCINKGNLYNASDIGGIIGYHRDVGRNNLKSTLIANSYNTGNIIVENETSNYFHHLGGLMGVVPESKIIIINSYNLGNISALTNYGAISGIIARTNYSAQIKLLNSYNIGNITGSDNLYKSGLTYIDIAKNSADIPDTHVLVDNFYNLGRITNKLNYGISYLANSSYIEAYNTYNNNYNEISNYELNNVFNKSEQEIKNQEFVDILNANIINEKTLKAGDEEIILDNIEDTLKGYHLSKWELSKDGYPTLVNE